MKRLLLVIVFFSVINLLVACTSGKNEATLKLGLDKIENSKDAIAFIVNNPTEEELSKIRNLKEFEFDKSNESLLVVPVNNNSSVKVIELTLYKEGIKYGKELFKTDSTSNNYALQIKATRPEGVPAMEIIVEKDGTTGEYQVSYNGKEGNPKVEIIKKNTK
ncbi:hypothetical protein PV797_07835 [Clostridiaceae bacterium M8S5]|nr:hypothetical protein PV797_07835 [Clostridiaceae bacterium M8S5]